MKDIRNRISRCSEETTWLASLEDEVVQILLSLRNRDGGFTVFQKSLKSTHRALVILQAIGKLSYDEKDINFVLSFQREDEHFGNVVDTFYAVKSLAMMGSLDKIRNRKKLLNYLKSYAYYNDSVLQYLSTESLIELGYAFSESEKDEIMKLLKSRQKEDGGFGNIDDTFYSVSMAYRLNRLNELKVKKLKNYLRRCYDNGKFRYSPNNLYIRKGCDCDYYGIMLAKMLNIFNEFDYSKIISDALHYTSSNWSHIIHGECDVCYGYSQSMRFFSILILKELHEIIKIDVERQSRFINDIHCENGGYGDVSDTPITSLVVYAFADLNRLSMLDGEKISNYFKQRQQEDGSIEHDASITALALGALKILNRVYKVNVQKALEFIESELKNLELDHFHTTGKYIFMPDLYHIVHGLYMFGALKYINIEKIVNFVLRCKSGNEFSCHPMVKSNNVNDALYALQILSMTNSLDRVNIPKIWNYVENEIEARVLPEVEPPPYSIGLYVETAVMLGLKTNRIDLFCSILKMYLESKDNIDNVLGFAKVLALKAEGIANLKKRSIDSIEYLRRLGFF